LTLELKNLQSLPSHTSCKERFSEHFDQKAETYLSTSEGVRGFFSKVTFLKLDLSYKKDKVCCQSHYMKVVQEAIFMEPNMRFGLILGWSAILKKKWG
jgi:hypothetical protein